MCVNQLVLTEGGLKIHLSLKKSPVQEPGLNLL